MILPLLALTIFTPQSGQSALPQVPFTIELVATSPTPSSLHAVRSSVIQLDFDHPVDAASFVAPQFQVFGRFSGVILGSLTRSLGGRRLTFTPVRDLSPGELVTVTLSRDLAGPNGNTLERPYAWSFWVASEPGDGSFSLKSTLVAGDVPYGAWGGDLDHDGDVDLCVPNEETRDVSVYLNLGGGNFTPETRYDVGWHASPSEGADFDSDGLVDLAVANIFDHDVSILFGNGDGSFDPQVRYDVGNQPRGIAVLDADGDGDTDIVTANRSSGDLSLLLNRGDGSFDPSTSFQAGVSNETGVVATDMNHDLHTDLVVIGYGSGQAAVMLGDGAGNFSFASSIVLSSGGSSPWMVVVGDVNGDGSEDVAAALSGLGRVAIARGNGQGGLINPITYTTGSFPIAVDLGDLDGDGHLDLSTSAFSGGVYRLRYNDGIGGFGPPTDLPALNAGSCTVLHDIDGDGDLDVTAIDELADRVFLFEQGP